MTPDEFAEAVGKLAKEAGFNIRDLSFTSAGETASGLHSYEGVSFGDVGNPLQTVLMPPR